MPCDDEVLPLQSRIESVGDDGDLQEVYDTERQLLYVACTRGLDQLSITGVDPASEFLDDLKGIDDGFRLLDAPRRPTLEEQSKLFLEHSEEREPFDREASRDRATMIADFMQVSIGILVGVPVTGGLGTGTDRAWQNQPTMAALLKLASNLDQIHKRRGVQRAGSVRQGACRPQGARCQLAN